MTTARTRRKAEWEIDLPDLEQAVLQHVITMFEALDAAFFMGQYGAVPNHIQERLDEAYGSHGPTVEDVHLPPAPTVDPTLSLGSS